MYVCVFVWVYVYMCTCVWLPVQASRCWIPWIWSYR